MALRKPVKILLIVLLISVGLYGAYSTLLYNVSPDTRLEVARSVYKKCLKKKKDKEVCQENFIRNTRTSPFLLKKKILDETIFLKERYNALKRFGKMSRILADFLDEEEAGFYLSIINNEKNHQNLKGVAFIYLFRTLPEDEIAKKFQKKVLESSTMTPEELVSVGLLTQAGEEMIDNLMELFEDKEPKISINASYILFDAGLKMKEKIPQLSKIALDENRPAQTRVNAIVIMGNLILNNGVKDKRIIETLELLSKNSNDRIRQGTNRLLEYLANN